MVAFSLTNLNKEWFLDSISLSFVSNGRDGDVQLSDCSWVEFEGERSTLSSGDGQLTTGRQRELTNVQVISYTHCNGSLQTRGGR